MNEIHCPNCHRLCGRDVTDSFEVDFSTNLLSLVVSSGYAPRIALEIKCYRCKIFFTCYGGGRYETRLQEHEGMASS